ncbi:MAG: hypothetical protein P8Y00_06950 [Deltaproteobacteria bacterium]|jgi:hypothetical protein
MRSTLVGKSVNGNIPFTHALGCQSPYFAGFRWGLKRYLDMDLFKDQELEEQLGAAIA